MAEQFLTAGILSKKKLFGVVSNNSKLVTKILASKQADEINRLIVDWGKYVSMHGSHAQRGSEPITLETAAHHIVSGRLQPTRATEYMRTVELWVEVLGKHIANETTLPGRGWQELGPTFSAWGLKTLASVWQKPVTFPWRTSNASRTVTWPRCMLIEFPGATAALRAELRAFDESRFAETPLPERLAGREDRIDECFYDIGVWLGGRGTDMVLILDGQQ